MLRESDLLESAHAWIADEDVKRHALAVSSEIEVSPLDRNPRCISWILESPDFVGQIVIWGDGQAEVDLADIATGEIRSEHRQIDDHDELASILGAVQDWVVREDSA
jgi:hypothetical protein